MRALVISGGGAKGAFAGGLSEYLIREEHKKYDLLVGTSAGSLLVPLLALGEVDRLRNVFSNVRQKDIFSRSPFIIRKRNGKFTARINHFNSIRMFLSRKKTFGESKNLRKLISRSFTKSDYDLLQKTGVNVLVTVCNFTKGQTEYKSVLDCNYEDFCDWMWISANFVPFMSLVTKNGCEYADGGYGDYLPLHPAISMGAKKIDCIYLRPELPEADALPSANPFDTLMKTMEFMLNRIGHDDIIIGNLQGQVKQLDIECYFAPYITDNPFIFDPKMMRDWWQKGVEYGRKTEPKCYCFS